MDKSMTIDRLILLFLRMKMYNLT